MATVNDWKNLIIKVLPYHQEGLRIIQPIQIKTKLCRPVYEDKSKNSFMTENETLR